MNKGTIVAAHIVRVYNDLYNQKEVRKPLTKLRFNRLLFLTQLAYYQKYKKFAIEEEFEYFKLGPVIRDVYREYILFSDSHNEYLPKSLLLKDGKLHFSNPLELGAEIDFEVEEVIMEVIFNTDEYDDMGLTQLTFNLIEQKERGIKLSEDTYSEAKPFLKI